jgi:hypothetical protein
VFGEHAWERRQEGAAGERRADAEIAGPRQSPGLDVRAEGQERDPAGGGGC